MLNDPWIITLSLIGTINTFLLLFGVIYAYNICKKWDISSFSEQQLKLEQKSYLVSTILFYSLSFEIISFLLFIITINNHLPPLIKGAMCATGSLNINQYGWYTLSMKIIELLLLSIWVFINHIDNKLPEYPLTKIKYLFLLAISPFIIVTFLLEILFFINIDTSIITTCCSISFPDANSTFQKSSFKAILNETSLLHFFYISYFLLLGFNVINLKSKEKTNLFKSLLATISGLVFSITTLLAVIFHFSKYIYKMPSHLCPFDMLWHQYYYIGYFIYLLLMLTTLSSLFISIIYSFSRNKIIKIYANKLYYKLTLCNLIFSTLLFIILILYKIEWKTSY